MSVKRKKSLYLQLEKNKNQNHQFNTHHLVMEPIKMAATGAVAVMALLGACTGTTGHQDSNGEADSAQAVVDTVALPDTTLASAAELTFTVEVLDSATSGVITDFTCPYDTVAGVFTFRGSSRRDAPFTGTVQGTPSRIVRDWVFVTDYDDTKTKLGTWGGGTGWTGQPLYVKWSEAQAAAFRRTSPGLTPDFGQEEIMVGSLCGRVYFLDFATGKPSRQPIVAGNPIKGTISLDPALNGSLYVGQGVPADPQVGHLAIDLNRHERAFFHGPDPKAQRHWNTYDSSPAVAGQFLFWPGENGTIYKYVRLGNGRLRLHSTLRYRAGGAAPGVENSMCIYKNYGYFGDNHGHVLCVNLNTMKPVWHYNNHDDIDGSLVLEVDNGVPFLYCGCEVDRQGDSGTCHMVKLNGLDGSRVWERTFLCHKLTLDGKHFDGGLYCTPLLGRGDCEGLLMANICQQGDENRARFTALDRRTGEVVYSTPLNYFSWTSPVGFLNERKELFVVTGDTSGNLYLIRGKTGEILFRQHMANNFESSPVVVGNSLVVGSRGQEIYRFHIE